MSGGRCGGWGKGYLVRLDPLPLQRDILSLGFLWRGPLLPRVVVASQSLEGTYARRSCWRCTRTSAKPVSILES